MKIPFNKPYFTGRETSYIEEAVNSGKISGDGIFTKRCHEFFEKQFDFKKCLLTTSCTDALEMAAILINITSGDEVIMPSYTFVSTANAFVLRGAKIVFADSCIDNPNIDVSTIEELITDKTKAIVVVHYAGIACDMAAVMELAEKYGLFVIEDAAQAIDSFFDNRPLGSIGHLAAFSFHETKNIISGEGGMLVINDERFIQRAEIIREKGTNRSSFFRGEVDKYGWVDIGSSFLPSDLIAAFLYAQLERLEDIQKRRKEIWERYEKGLSQLFECGVVKASVIPRYATNNYHMYYLILDNIEIRDKFIQHLLSNNIQSVFHYLSLHKSKFYRNRHDGRTLKNSDYFADRVVRLPFYYELTDAQQSFIIAKILDFFKDE